MQEERLDFIGSCLQLYSVNDAHTRALFRVQLAGYFARLRIQMCIWEAEPPALKNPIAQLEKELHRYFGLSCQALRCLVAHESFGFPLTSLIPAVRGLADLFERALEDQFAKATECLPALTKIDENLGLMLEVSSALDARGCSPFNHVGFHQLTQKSPSPGVHFVRPGPADSLDDPREAIHLNAAQQRIAKSLEFFWWLRSEGYPLAGHRARETPLIVGPSGSGKSRLVKTFAKSQSIEMTSLCTGTWIPIGARSDEWTVHRLVSAVRSSERGIVFLDEIDKLTQPTEWTRGIQQEIFALIDGRFEDIPGWDKSLTRKFRKHFLVVGAGTWQDLYAVNQPTMGFRVEEQPDWNIDLSKQQAIPPELLLRFNPDLLVMDPMSSEEYAERIESIRFDAGAPPLTPEELRTLSREAVASGLHNRWLETYVGRLLQESFRFKRAMKRRFLRG